MRRRLPLHDPLAVELRHLRYFVAVFEELHFGRAAERLHISQPPLSLAIRKLEEELGVQLLDRTSRVVTATEAGRVFAEEARKVLAGFELAVAETRRAGGSGSKARIGCGWHVPIERLLRFLDILRASEPGLLPEVTHLGALEQVRRLRAGELDLGIFTHSEEYEGIELEPLFPGEPLAALLAPEHHLVSRPVLGPDDLREEVLVMFPRAGNPALHDRLLALMETSGYRFRSVHEVSGHDPRDRLLAVADNLGVALVSLPPAEIEEAGATVVRRPLDPPLMMPESMLAWRTPLPRQLQALLAKARAAAQQLRQTPNVSDADGVGLYPPPPAREHP